MTDLFGNKLEVVEPPASNLFEDTVVSSISFSQDEIIRDIIKLYIPEGKFHADCTFSKGEFYKHGIPRPELCFDITPQAPGVVQASADKLPLKDKSVRSIMFDPPFVATWNVESADYGMTTRFTNIPGIANLRAMYADSIKEFARVLKINGYLVVKCQDTVYAGVNYFNHIFIYENAIKHNFIARDLFVLLSKKRFIGKGKQHHSRKFHCYFWVFKKSRKKREYIKKV